VHGVIKNTQNLNFLLKSLPIKNLNQQNLRFFKKIKFYFPKFLKKTLNLVSTLKKTNAIVSLQKPFFKKNNFFQKLNSYGQVKYFQNVFLKKTKNFVGITKSYFKKFFSRKNKNQLYSQNINSFGTNLLPNPALVFKKTTKLPYSKNFLSLKTSRNASVNLYLPLPTLMSFLKKYLPLLTLNKFNNYLYVLYYYIQKVIITNDKYTNIHLPNNNVLMQNTPLAEINTIFFLKNLFKKKLITYPAIKDIKNKIQLNIMAPYLTVNNSDSYKYAPPTQLYNSKKIFYRSVEQDLMSWALTNLSAYNTYQRYSNVTLILTPLMSSQLNNPWTVTFVDNSSKLFYPNLVKLTKRSKLINNASVLPTPIF
jgi:hypothetical protein